MEKDLGARAFCVGDRFSLADVSTVYALGYLDYALPEIKWRETCPHLVRYAERMAQRESCARTVQTPWTY
jgi:glutathione S-transferase